MWPDEPDKALGMKLSALRELANGRMDIGIFGFHVYGRRAGNGQEGIAAAVIQRIVPAARKLRRYLERN